MVVGGGRSLCQKSLRPYNPPNKILTRPVRVVQHEMPFRGVPSPAGMGAYWDCLYVQLLLKAAQGSLGLVRMQVWSGGLAAGCRSTLFPWKNQVADFQGCHCCFLGRT